jgi:hypothetical protein
MGLKVEMDNKGAVDLANNWSIGGIRSSIMSHIAFRMCPFVLIIYLRDYQYDFDLDIVVLWSCYGVL